MGFKKYNNNKYLSYVGKTFAEIRYKKKEKIILKMNTNILPHV